MHTVVATNVHRRCTRKRGALDVTGKKLTAPSLPTSADLRRFCPTHSARPRARVCAWECYLQCTLMHVHVTTVASASYLGTSGRCDYIVIRPVDMSSWTKSARRIELGLAGVIQLCEVGLRQVRLTWLTSRGVVLTTYYLLPTSYYLSNESGSLSELSWCRPWPQTCRYHLCACRYHPCQCVIRGVCRRLAVHAVRSLQREGCAAIIRWRAAQVQSRVRRAL